MLNFTRQNPTMRANKIMEGFNNLNYRGNDCLRQFGLRISEQMAMVYISLHNFHFFLMLMLIMVIITN